MIGFICGLIATLIFTVAATGAWAAQPKRVALVIGNGAYQFTSPLTNPTNDAGDMAAALKRLGFEVLEGRDLDESGMRRTIKGFAELLIGADVGLLFYAGHGLQVNGQNYLVPVDAKLENPAGLDFELIRLDVIHRTMERETKTNVIFLDACRDNPLSRNLARSMGTRSSQIGKGLAVVESGVGTLISFSTQPGNTALDGEGRNSPFAASLIRHISDPREDLSTLLIQVRNDVMAATKDQQIPVGALGVAVEILLCGGASTGTGRAHRGATESLGRGAHGTRSGQGCRGKKTSRCQSRGGRNQTGPGGDCPEAGI